MSSSDSNNNINNNTTNTTNMDADKPPLVMDVVGPRVDTARVDRGWESVHDALTSRRESRRNSGSRNRKIGGGLVVLALAAAITLIVGPRLWSSNKTDDRLSTTTPSTTASVATDSLTLPDGSRILSSRSARFALDSATTDHVAIQLQAGELDLDVSHVPGRTFTVNVAGYEVSVLGTRFHVRLLTRGADHDDHVIAVSVDRGRVRVKGFGQERFLNAGESWSSPPTSTTAVIATATTAPSGSSALPATTASTAAPAVAANDAKTLFAHALDAQLAGRDREAAASFDAVRKRHRSDPRAGLAAFELGRIRLDSLHDPAAAVEAFTDAIELSPSASYREDAEARRVDALDALGDRPRCAKARAAYLERYPSGLHARRIMQRCSML